MSQKARTELSKIEKTQRKQQRTLNEYKKREQWIRWIVIALIALILLLILFFGYATDWTRGLNKDSAYKATPVASGLDSVTGADTSTANTTGGSGGGSTTSTNGESSGTNTSTTKETTTNNTTTTNTTTNNGGTDTTTPSNGLLNLYANSDTGKGIDDILGLANGLGITAQCSNDILIQTCNFTQDGFTVTTKNLRGTGIVTSLTKNF